MHNIFTKHPHEQNESYWQHLRVAGGLGLKLIGTGVILIVHSLFPFLFVKTGSNFACKFCEQLKARGASPAEREATQNEQKSS